MYIYFDAQLVFVLCISVGNLLALYSVSIIVLEMFIVLFEQPIWLTTYMTTIIFKVGICTETKAIDR